MGPLQSDHQQAEQGSQAQTEEQNGHAAVNSGIVVSVTLHRSVQLL
jgi:hypothetical protein